MNVPEEEPAPTNGAQNGSAGAPKETAPPGPDVSLLSKKDRHILELRNQGLGYDRIAREVKLSKTSIHDRVKELTMRGFLDPIQRPGEKDEDEGGAAGQGGGASIVRSARGRASLQASRTAGEWAVETLDLFTQTGEWAWTTFKQEAAELGFDTCLDWLKDCVEYWKTERLGWQSVLDQKRLLEQEVAQLVAERDLLRDLGAFRTQLMDAVVASNVAGDPLSGEQIAALVSSRLLGTRPVLALPGVVSG
jgi:hypothetical protein